MTKNEFLAEVERCLVGLGRADIDRSLEYYKEMLDDRMEDGESESEAVAAMGSPEETARQIMMDMPLPKIVKAKALGNRRLRAWEIVLLALGLPVWLPLLLAALVVLVAVYVVIWAVDISFWAVDVLFTAISLSGFALFGVLLGAGNASLALLCLAIALLFGGLTLFTFLGCRAFTVLIAKLGVLIWKGIKAMFVGKGDKKA